MLGRTNQNQPCEYEATLHGDISSTFLQAQGEWDCLPCPPSNTKLIVPIPEATECTLGEASSIYYHQNEQQSVFAVTNQTGVVLEGYAFDPYGATTVFKPGANGVVDFGGDDVVAGIDASSLSVWTYTGRRYDSESGLLYYRTRYLDSEMGRFISRDTIGVWGDPASLGNGFSALLNAAQRVTDPCGTLGGKPNPEGLREHADKLGKLVSEFLVKARDWWNLSGCRGGLGTDYQSILDEATAAEFLARSTADAIDDAGDGLAWWQTALLGLFIVLAVAAVIAACVLSGGACAAVLGGGAVAGAVSG